MVEHFNIHQRQGFFQCTSEHLVRATGFSHAGRMVVGKDHRRRIVMQGTFHHFTLVNRGLRQRPGKQLLAGHHAMLRVQQQHHEHLTRQVAQLQAQVITHGCGGVKHATLLHFFLQGSARHFKNRLQLRVFAAAYAIHLGQVIQTGAEYAIQAATSIQQITRQIHRAFARHAHSQENRQQLGIGQHCRAFCQQLLARSLVCGPVGDCHD
jgi:hypothetical protein